ncbi:hypothetical protein KEM52_003619 [Ascosphaera acerosa]|nr:hypothetical protein KEM52_003619 [Ascosphaera acerosa]
MADTAPPLTPPYQTAFYKLLSVQRCAAPDAISGDCATVDDPGPQQATACGSSGRVEWFKARHRPFKPSFYDNAFGGHVFAQSAWAAAQTVGPGLLLHNISGSFVRPGGGRGPMTFSVRHVRDGSTYCFRSVDAYKDNGELCFTCIANFKTQEPGYNYGHQRPYVIPTQYSSILHGEPHHYDKHPRIPFLDTLRFEGDNWGDDRDVARSGIEARKATMAPYAAAVGAEEHPDRYRQLQFYHLIGLFGAQAEEAESQNSSESSELDLEVIRKNDEAGRYDNLYICVHLFQSDRNSLFIVPWALGKVDCIVGMASLSHTVIIHTHGPALRMVAWDAEGKPRPKWFTMESRSSKSAENRGLFEARLWGTDGTLVATAVQDGMIRLLDRAPESGPKL